MLRTLVLASAALTATVAPLTLAAPANAAPFVDVRVGVGPRYYPVYRPAPVVVVERPVHRHFCVLYRGCCNEAWREYGVYLHRERAIDVEASLAARGFEACIVHR
jgi:hypothetical protein